MLFTLILAFIIGVAVSAILIHLFDDNPNWSFGSSIIFGLCGFFGTIVLMLCASGIIKPAVTENVEVIRPQSAETVYTNYFTNEITFLKEDGSIFDNKLSRYEIIIDPTIEKPEIRTVTYDYEKSYVDKFLIRGFDTRLMNIKAYYVIPDTSFLPVSEVEWEVNI